MKKSEKRMLFSLLLEEDGDKSNLNIESVIERLKRTEEQLVEKYEQIINKYEGENKSFVVTVLSWIKNIIRRIKFNDDLNKADNFDKFVELLNKSIRETINKLRKYYDDTKDPDALDGVKYFLSNYNPPITFNPETDANNIADVSKKFGKNLNRSSAGHFIIYLSDNREFIKKFSQQYLVAVAQVTVTSLFDKVKDLFKSPKKALDKIKEFVENIKQKFSNTVSNVKNSSVGQKVSQYLPSGTVGKLILGVAIVVVLLIAIKKFPIIGRFFGKVWKLLLMPFNKIISFFRKAPELLEAYLTDPVARKLIETKMKRLDMYTALYLSA